METSEAFDVISRAIDSGRANRGFLVTGNLPGNTEEFTELVASRLFGEGGARPDMVVLEPEGRTRSIRVKTMREALVVPMGETAYAGGWKLGVVKGADRMTKEAANAFLKSLEEPTPKTMYLLLTDNPDECLPTIVSRCQRIDLVRTVQLLEGGARAAVEKALLSCSSRCGVMARDAQAAVMADVLDELKGSAEDEEFPLLRKRFFNTVMAVVRGWMVEGKVERFRAFRNVEAVEEAFARSCKSIGDDAVISAMMDKITFPAP